MTKPEIRFPDFNNEWKEYTLNELLVEHKTRNKATLFEEVFSVAKSKGVINQIEHLGRSYASNDISNYKVVFPEDIVYTKSPTEGYPFGIIKQNKTNRTGVVSVLYAVFKPKTKNIGSLIDIYFSSKTKTYNYLIPLVNRGAKNTMNISNDVFLRGKVIPLPTDENEREKLSNFFHKIDEYVENLSTKKNELINYKNSLVQDFFNQEMSDKKGSKDFKTWNHINLGKLLKRYSEPVEIENDRIYQEIGIRSHGKGIFHKNPVNGKTIGKKRVFWLKEGVLILNIVFAWERALSLTTSKEKDMIASHRFPMYEPKNDKVLIEFVLLFLLTPKGRHLLELASPGGAGRNKTLGQAEFNLIKIPLPTIEEQKEIIELTNRLNYTISNYKDKIEELKCYKNLLLNKMFI